MLIAKKTYELLLEEAMNGLKAPWKAINHAIGNLTWIHFQRNDAQLEEQGWKIHLTAGAVEAELLIERVLPYLLTQKVQFKLPESREMINHLNAGHGGSSQLGKVLTVYPASQAECSEIAQTLDRLWHSQHGPIIPSDLRFSASSSVFLRYGAFSGKAQIRRSNGEIVPALRHPDGFLVEDERTTTGQQPTWATLPPGIAAFEGENLLEMVQINQNSYLPVLLLQTNTKGKVVLAIDMQEPRTVIIKTARRGVASNSLGVDATHLLENEYQNLKTLWHLGQSVPQAIDFERQNEQSILILEHIEGISFINLSIEEKIRVFPEVLQKIVDLHDANWVHHDLKPPNILVNDQDITLIDFELANTAGQARVSQGQTRVYGDPESNELANPASDVHSLGVCLASIFLPAEPSQLPTGAGRLVHLLKLQGHQNAAKFVQRATQARGSRSTALLLQAQFKNLEVEQQGATSLPKEISLRRWAKKASLAAGLAVQGFEVWHNNQLAWRNEHLYKNVLAEGINIGASGIMLGLTTLDQSFKRSDQGSSVQAAADWLAHRPSLETVPGLFTGDAGVALALAVSGNIDAAKQRLGAAIQAPNTSPDFFSGHAGILWAGVQIAELLNNSSFLEMVKPLAQTMLETVDLTQGIPLWFDQTTLAVNTQFGAAHGSAGIALALAAWGKTTNDTRALKAIFVHGQGEHGTDLRHSLNGQTMPNTNWCHGAAGYLWVLLQIDPNGTSLTNEIDWAARVFLNTTVLSSPTYCHGLAGQLELCMMLQAVPRWNTSAASKALNVVATLRALYLRRAGGHGWSSENPEQVTPDLWVGFLGPATALARWSAKQQTALLSSQSLRSMKGA
jgi:serine/threonine protein kinase